MTDFRHVVSPSRRAFPRFAFSSLVWGLLALALFSWGLASSPSANAQGGPFGGGEVTPEQMERFKNMRRQGGRGGRGRGGRPGRQPTAVTPNKKGEKKDGKKDEKKEGDKDKEKKDEAAKTIKRPTDGTSKLDPNRMRLQPDKNGLVQFNYNGHPWADVLQEYSDAAKLSFDWQELPSDGLNLLTQKKYTLDQARNLLNQHLLARGFTLLLHDELLSAVKISKIDPSLIPRVEADDLEDHQPYDFVRVLFQLPKTMDPAKAKEDVTVLLSPNAKVTPLLSSKRLLIIDAVANLRSARDLIYAEQLAADSIVKPEIYHIMHRRADYVADQIMIVLGMDPGSRKSPQEIQLETQRMQMAMQMQQKGNKNAKKMVGKAKLAVHIAVDRIQNTLMVNAPAELLPTIERTIEQCDRPQGAALAGSVGGRSTQAHKTRTASTDAVVSALTDFGQLDPLTRLQSDSRTRTIFAYATVADHDKISQMIKELDSSGRGIHVIPLRRYPVAQIAGTLTSLFEGEGQESSNNNGRNRRNRYFDFGGYGMSMGGGNQKQEGSKFKVEPDIENNRLILWANEDEMVKVRDMLVRLGESGEDQAPNTSKVRVLTARTPEETAELLKRLKAAYPGKINIEMPDSMKPKETVEQDEQTEITDKVTQFSPEEKRRSPVMRLVSTPAKSSAPAASGAAASPPAASPPAASPTTVASSPAGTPEVNITISNDGQIVISSADPAALDQLENLVETFSAPKQEFVHFKIKYVYASGLSRKLEAYFKEALKGQTESRYDMWGNYQGRKDKDPGPQSLGSAKKMRFMAEDYTNTVIVQGASETQLAVIEKLIKLYDQAPAPENYLTRKTKVIQLEFSKAQNIANSLKEVYRELLSSKDKEFQDQEGSSSIIGGSKPTYVFGDVGIDEHGNESPVLIKFDGILSIGVDQVSNTLIISARKEVLDSIEETVHLLDMAAKPNTMVHVHRVGGKLTAAGMQKTLRSSLGQPWPGGKPVQASAGGGGNSQAKQQQQQLERMRQMQSQQGQGQRGRGRGGRGRGRGR